MTGSAPFWTEPEGEWGDPSYPSDAEGSSVDGGLIAGDEEDSGSEFAPSGSSSSSE